MKENPLISVLFVLLFFGQLRANPVIEQRSNIFRPIEELLNHDGSLDLTSGYQGALQFSGFNIVMDAQRGLLACPIPPNSMYEALGPGLNTYVVSILVIGNDVYVGGSFTDAAGIPAADRIAKWDGYNWSALGSGLNGDVNSISTNGTDIYVGGRFTNAGGIPEGDYIAKWDGANWSALGSGLNLFVEAVACNGTDVYVGGQFTNAGGISTADYITKWNGSSWSSLGSGLNEFVTCIAINGTDVYIGGGFTDAGGNTLADHIAKWNGSNWSALGSGLNNFALAIAVSGSSIYVGGQFTDAGGNTACDYIAKWNGSSWLAIGSGLSSIVNSVAVIGSYLYVGGAFQNAGGNASADCIARWDGSTWQAIGSGLSSQVFAIAEHSSGIYIGGFFSDAGGISAADHIAKITEAPLPVELIKFRAESSANTNHLTWITSNESNTAYFGIERSSDGTNFNEIGEIQSLNKAAEYNFDDFDQFPDLVFYRLKIVDFGGEFKFSNIVVLQSTYLQNDMTFCPNPAQQVFSILPNKDIEKVRLVNLSGETVLSASKGFSNLDISRLEKGEYIVIVNIKESNLPVIKRIILN